MGIGRKMVVAGVALATMGVPTASMANPFAVFAAGRLLGHVFGHHSGTTQAQGVTPAGESSMQTKMEKVQLQNIRDEIARERKAHKWKPLKQVKYLPPNASQL